MPFFLPGMLPSENTLLLSIVFKSPMIQFTISLGLTYFRFLSNSNTLLHLSSLYLYPY